MLHTVEYLPPSRLIPLLFSERPEMPSLKITLTIDVEPEDHDPDDPTGLTEPAYQKLMEQLQNIGHDIETELE